MLCERYVSAVCGKTPSSCFLHKLQFVGAVENIARLAGGYNKSLSLPSQGRCRDTVVAPPPLPVAPPAATHARMYKHSEDDRKFSFP